jgi:hypothetical protein
LKLAGFEDRLDDFPRRWLLLDGFFVIAECLPAHSVGTDKTIDPSEGHDETRVSDRMVYHKRYKARRAA